MTQYSTKPNLQSEQENGILGRYTDVLPMPRRWTGITLKSQGSVEVCELYQKLPSHHLDIPSSVQGTTSKGIGYYAFKNPDEDKKENVS